MHDTLDTLAAKAEALEAMRSRKDPNYEEALALYKRELKDWQTKLTNEILNL